MEIMTSVHYCRNLFTNDPELVIGKLALRYHRRPWENGGRCGSWHWMLAIKKGPRSIVAELIWFALSINWKR